MAWTDVAEAWGAVGAIAVSLGTTWWATHQTKAERKRSDDALRDERARVDQALRVARDLAVLQEIYDLYAEHFERRGHWNNAARLKVQTRLALLPQTVATTIRSLTGGRLDEESGAKLEWVAARAQMPTLQPNAQDAPLDMPQEELPADVWFLTVNPPDRGGAPWWEAYGELHAPVMVPTIPAPAKQQEVEP